MLPDVHQPERVRLQDQLAEETVAPRQRADQLSQRVVDADVDELVQFLAVVVDHTERAVPGADQLASGLYDLAQQQGEAHISGERSERVEQAAQSVGPDARVCWPDRVTHARRLMAR